MSYSKRNKNDIFWSKDINAKHHFHLQNFLQLPTVSLQNSHFLLILDVCRSKKALFRNKKRCDRKKLFGLNRPYMSYSMKFAFYLHLWKSYGTPYEFFKKFSKKVMKIIWYPIWIFQEIAKKVIKSYGTPYDFFKKFSKKLWKSYGIPYEFFKKLLKKVIKSYDTPYDFFKKFSKRLWKSYGTPYEFFKKLFKKVIKSYGTPYDFFQEIFKKVMKIIWGTIWIFQEIVKKKL